MWRLRSFKDNTTHRLDRGSVLQFLAMAVTKTNNPRRNFCATYDIGTELDKLKRAGSLKAPKGLLGDALLGDYFRSLVLRGVTPYRYSTDYSKALTGKLLLDSAFAKRRQPDHEVDVADLVTSCLVEHAEQALQNLFVRLRNAYQIYGLPDA